MIENKLYIKPDLILDLNDSEAIINTCNALNFDYGDFIELLDKKTKDCNILIRTYTNESNNIDFYAIPFFILHIKNKDVNISILMYDNSNKDNGIFLLNLLKNIDYNIVDNMLLKTVDKDIIELDKILSEPNNYAILVDKKNIYINK